MLYDVVDLASVADTVGHHPAIRCCHARAQSRLQVYPAVARITGSGVRGAVLSVARSDIQWRRLDQNRKPRRRPGVVCYPTQRSAVGMAGEVYLRHRHAPEADGEVAQDRGREATKLSKVDLLYPF